MELRMDSIGGAGIGGAEQFEVSLLPRPGQRRIHEYVAADRPPRRSLGSRESRQ
jgi:hypothetical protein